MIAECETRIAIKCGDGETIAYLAMGPHDAAWAVEIMLALNCMGELMEAHRKIAQGEGFYGLQAKEYKDISKAAITSVKLMRKSIQKEVGK